jgi:hypothetical protein
MVVTQAESRSQSTLAAGDEPRLEMRSRGAAIGYVDGGWWRSTDPAVEFPALVRALHEVIGQVSRVAYTAIGVNSQRVTLLVVLPAMPDRAAGAALRAAGDQDSAATVEDILTGGGAGPEAGAASPATPTARRVESRLRQ